MQDAFPAGKFRRSSLHHTAARIGVCMTCPYDFGFFSLGQPKEVMGMVFASGAHSSTVVNNNQAALIFWLASAGPMGVKRSRRKLWKSPDRFREEQPALLEVIT